MKRLFCLLLCLIFALPLTACGPAPSDPTETVENPFTSGQAAPSATTDNTEPQGGGFSFGGTVPPAAATDSTTEPSHSGFGMGLNFVHAMKDEAGNYYEYTGGELHAYFHFECSDDYSVCGVGPLLYLDGIPQPYKTDEEPWYSYLHLFYPAYDAGVNPEEKYATDQVFDLYFIPVTGQTGDALELYGTPISNPYMDPRDPEFNNYFLTQHMNGSVPARIIFQATPPELELPEVPDQLLSHSVTYVDEPLLQYWTPEELQSQRKYGYTINGEPRPENTNSWIWYGFDQEPITLDFYIYGDSYVKYTLVCYKNYQPISVDPEDIVYVEVKDGQRTQIQVQIDMSDFDGSTPICFMPVLIPRNLQAYEDGTYAGQDHHARCDIVELCYFGGEEE